ncbi:hypothetical protein Srufu_004550 [Streptomyces libani subsp. rufus]|nr:hypothetical protein Srufu_004550 [Streptomyces libani subsp. rufus]
MEQELLALLKQHEETARRRAEERRAEPAALNEQIAAGEEELSDLVVAQVTLSRVEVERGQRHATGPSDRETRCHGAARWHRRCGPPPHQLLP